MANILGKNLKEFRLGRGLKQDDIARALDVPPPTYSSWERGRTEPSIDWLLRLASYHDVSVDRLLHFDLALKIGSWFPLGEHAKFHPLKYEIGFYTLIYSLVFNRLFFFDIYERRFHVELIDSWIADKSDCSYTLYLRRGIRFHSEQLLELEDVKYSYEEFLKHHDFYRRFIDDVEIGREDNSIKLRLKRWLELHDLPGPYIIPRIYEDDDQCFEGTGPFRLTGEYQDRLREGFESPVILESNNEYFAKVPFIRTTKLYRIGKVDELGDSLKKGEVNFAIGLPGDKSGKFDVKYGFGNISFYFVLKPDSAVCQDESFRKGVDFALDRESLIDTMRDLTGIGNAQVLPNRHLYNLLQETPSRDDGNNYDQDKAKECWEEAKASLSEMNVTDFRFRIAPIVRDNEVALRLIDEIVKQLQEVGIEAEREEADSAEVHALVGVINFNTPESLYVNLHSKESERRRAPWRYKNPYMDKLLDNIEGTETYKKIQEILSAEQMFIPLLRYGVSVTHAKNLDTKSKLRVTSLLYGPDVVHWEFR